MKSKEELETIARETVRHVAAMDLSWHVFPDCDVITAIIADRLARVQEEALNSVLPSFGTFEDFVQWGIKDHEVRAPREIYEWIRANMKPAPQISTTPVGNNIEKVNLATAKDDWIQHLEDRIKALEDLLGRKK